MITPTAIDWDRDGDPDLIVGDEDGRGCLRREPRQDRQRSTAVRTAPLLPPASRIREVRSPGHTARRGLGRGRRRRRSGGQHRRLHRIHRKPGRQPAAVRSAADTCRRQRDNSDPSGPERLHPRSLRGQVGIYDHRCRRLDGDGLFDIIANSIWGRIVWYRNIGAPGKPALEAAKPVRIEWGPVPEKPSWNWWDPGLSEMASQWRTRPVPVDWDEDGLMDLIMLDHEGFVAWFKRVRRQGSLILTPGKRIFESRPISEYDNRHRHLERRTRPAAAECGPSRQERSAQDRHRGLGPRRAPRPASEQHKRPLDAEPRIARWTHGPVGRGTAYLHGSLPDIPPARQRWTGTVMDVGNC